MKVVFRTDASLQIGTGHVMRCLTLADALADKGAECQFICRAHEGHLIEFIRNNGYTAHVLPFGHKISTGSNAPSLNVALASTAHSHWLGATQAEDAEDVASILAEQRPDWLIVDHYALDARWERALAPHCRKVMVIDDLADRPHACDLLLDQTFGREAADYRPFVPADCRLLCGSGYALLRPEFAALRPYSLQRRDEPALCELLITMGGVDKDNATGQMLEALRTCPLPSDCRITVVMGATAPWLEEIRTKALVMPLQTRVLVGVSDMAQLMADSDLAIGAAGATAWERCCLGLPTIMVVLADNQRKIADGLCEAGAAHLVGALKINNQLLIATEDINPLYLKAMSRAAAAITDGAGVAHVAETLFNWVEHAN